MGNPPLKHPPPKNQGHSPLPLLETNHPQREGIDLTKNQGISNDLPNSDRVVGPDTTPAASNIAAKPLLPHPPTNQPHVSLPLPITDHPQEERIDSLENQGISSSQKLTEKLSENAAHTADTATATTIQPATTATSPAAAEIATKTPKQIYIPPGMYNEEKDGDGYDTDGQIGPFLGAMKIEGTQIFEEEEANPPAAVPVQKKFKSATRMVLEVAAAAGAAGPEPLANQYIAWVKEELKLRCQYTQGNKKLLLERSEDEIKRKLVRYLMLEEAKANSKSKNKKKVGDGVGMKQVGMKQFPSTEYWKVLQPETAVVSESANPRFKGARAPTITEAEAKYVP